MMTAQEIASTAGCKLTMPSRKVTDRRFRYVEAAKTDVRRTWRKARLYMALNARKAA